MPPESKFIIFDETSPEVYEIKARKTKIYLGIIRNYSPWKQFAMFPEDDTIWSNECLNDIITFLDELNEIK